MWGVYKYTIGPSNNQLTATRANSLSGQENISNFFFIFLFLKEAQNQEEEEEEKGKRDVKAKGMTGQNDLYILSIPEMSFITEKECSSLRYE